MSPEIFECCRIWTRQRADRPACKQHLSTRRAAGQDTRVTSWSRRQRKFITWFVLLTFRKKLWLRPMYWRLPFLSFFSSHLSLPLFTFIVLFYYLFSPVLSFFFSSLPLSSRLVSFLIFFHFLHSYHVYPTNFFLFISLSSFCHPLSCHLSIPLLLFPITFPNYLSPVYPLPPVPSNSLFPRDPCRYFLSLFNSTCPKIHALSYRFFPSSPFFPFSVFFVYLS